MDIFAINLLFLLPLIRIIPGDIIFYIVYYRDALQSLVDLSQIVSSLVLDDEIQDLKEVIIDIGEFLCLPNVI